MIVTNSNDDNTNNSPQGLGVYYAGGAGLCRRGIMTKRPRAINLRGQGVAVSCDVTSYCSLYCMYTLYIQYTRMQCIQYNPHVLHVDAKT